MEDRWDKFARIAKHKELEDDLARDVAEYAAKHQLDMEHVNFISSCAMAAAMSIQMRRQLELEVMDNPDDALPSLN